MIPNNEGNANNGAGKTPVDHLRTFVSSVMEPANKKEEAVPVQEGEQPPMKPFRGRDTTLDKSEDRTLKFILAGAGGVVVLILLILGLSQKHAAKRPKPNAPGIGRVQPPQTNETAPSNGSIVPKTSMLPPPAENTKKGKLTARDLENTAGQKPSAQVTTPQATPADQSRTLAQVPPFNPGQPTSDTWSPKPYTGQQEQTNVQRDKAESAALAKPSLVFVANTTERTSSSETGAPLVPSLGLGTGARLSARLGRCGDQKAIVACPGQRWPERVGYTCMWNDLVDPTSVKLDTI